MIARTKLMFILLLASTFAAGCQSNGGHNAVGGGQWTTYGESPMGEGDAVSIGALSGEETAVVIHGTIVEVCKVKGCWMTLRDDSGKEIFVKFKDYSFFVPRNAAGRRAVVHGWTVKKTMSVEELRHYAEDVHKSPEEIAAITEPQTRITFYADSVMISGRGLQKPYQSRPGDECY